MTSGLSGADVDVIKQAPGIRRDDGKTALAAAELLVIIDLPKLATPDAPANVPVRGISAESIPMRKEFSLVEGRMFQFGTNEVIAGRAASGQFVNLKIGDTIVTGQNRWNVVGIFEVDGGVAETEIWIDARVLQGAYRRGNTYQSLLAQLDSRDSYDAFRDYLTSNPQLNVSIRRENEYYATQSQALTRLIQTIGFGIAGLMGIGAVFGAILTMYTAVATRAREIATLRALGFNTGSVLVSVLAESMVLGLIGGSIGGAAAYLAFNGYQTSTMNFQTLFDRRTVSGHPCGQIADTGSLEGTLNWQNRRFGDWGISI
jgi:putative ABC transport system permease protein